MKIYGEGKEMQGTFIRRLLVEFVKDLRGRLIVCKGPPIMEIYAPEAEDSKPIDLEICAYMTPIIIASQRGGG